MPGAELGISGNLPFSLASRQWQRSSPWSRENLPKVSRNLKQWNQHFWWKVKQAWVKLISVSILEVRSSASVFKEKKFYKSILKETSPGCSLKGLMLKLKLQSFGHLMRRIDSLEKTLMLGGSGGRRRRGRQRMRWLDGVTDSMDMSLSELRMLGGLACCNSWGCKETDMTEGLN